MVDELFNYHWPISAWEKVIRCLVVLKVLEITKLDKKSNKT